MRSPEQQEVALRCVDLACGNIDYAKDIYAFVTGQEQDDAKRKLDAVREVISEKELPSGTAGKA